jgi:hypothetical protein
MQHSGGGKETLMPHKLEVPNAFAAGLAVEAVGDGTGNTSPLRLSKDSVVVQSVDTVGKSFPFTVHASPAEKTFGRLLRLAAANSSHFYDLGIDAQGDFFINGPASVDIPILTITPDGVMKIRGREVLTRNPESHSDDKDAHKVGV